MNGIVIYYSYGGNTRRVAEEIRNKLNLDIVELETVKPYTGSYNEVVDQGQREVNRGFMPKIKPVKIDFSQYDVVILGSPVWWYTFAPAMKTFLNSADLSGKKVYPFATNGGWIGHTWKDFEKACTGARVLPGLNVRFNEDKQLTPKEDIEKWIQHIEKQQ